MLALEELARVVDRDPTETPSLSPGLLARRALEPEVSRAIGSPVERDGPARPRIVIDRRAGSPRAARRATTPARGRPLDHDARCAFCHGAFSVAGEAPLSCPSCATLLHHACWHEVRRCPSIGCRGPGVKRAPAAPAVHLRRRLCAAALHAVAFGLGTTLALALTLVGLVSGSVLRMGRPRGCTSNVESTLLLTAVFAVAWLIVLVGVARRPRWGRWLEADLPLIGSGLVAGLVIALLGW